MPPILATFLLLLLSSASTSAALMHLNTYCPNTTFFPATNSALRSNLHSLLSNLSSAANLSSSSFHNSTIYTSPSLYGLYLCRGDVDTPTCRDCVAAASSDLSKNCPLSYQAIVWYDECMVRYSNTTFFGQSDANVYIPMSNVNNFTGNVTNFYDVQATSFTTVSTEAASGSAALKFATDEPKLNEFQNLYVLGQCTPDLSGSDCYGCLQVCIHYMPNTFRQGGRVLFFSCNLRYEIYRFYNKVAAPPALAPAPAPVPAPHLSASNSSALNGTTIASGSVELTAGKKSSSKLVIGVISGAVAAGLLLVVVVACLFTRKKENKYAEAAVAEASATNEFTTTIESLQYEFSTLQAATNNFCDERKIGEGGFGGVYLAVLPNGQEVAVKRLSRSSGQGTQEFKNEVVLVAKLQHRNLVRVMGFCVTGQEKLLVYEYVPNRSLDSFLFDPEKQGELDWSRRLKIIVGIARGMLYLHEDSRLRIIHRDLKASNVLLDEDMNAKISDFGLARIFGEDETQGNTNKVVGTYGYMSPEYAFHGRFSVKSDVYSFGVIVLEIVSVKRNTSFYESGYADDLLSYAWKLWSKGAPIELVDTTMRDSCSLTQVMRCIHIGLLCVQDEIEERPTMGSILLMLNNNSMTLSVPKQPAFFTRPKTSSDNSSRSKSAPWSVNDVSITELDPR